MQTTLLNPTCWLLAALLACALTGLVGGWSATHTLDVFLRRATAWPVLGVVAIAAVGGLGSRAVLGYLSPGSYAEEVVAARAFLASGGTESSASPADLQRWLQDEPSPVNAWTLPGLSVCQASAFRDRPRFFTTQAHSPMLLLASAPVVRVLGGRGLYLVFLALSLAAILVIAHVLARELGLRLSEPRAVLLGLALAGWQPVLAGIRQGDAVLPAAALVVISWARLRQHRPVSAGVCAGLAASLVVPAIGTPIACARRPRACVAAVATMAVSLATILVAGGPALLGNFAAGIVSTAHSYAQAIPNYALAGRALGSGVISPWIAAAALGVCATAVLWRARSIDETFALFSLFGLLLAPLAWSQHLTLAVVALVLLFRICLEQSLSLGLALWALVALALSLPDPMVARIGDAVASVAGGSPQPVVPAALAGIWLWILVAAGRRRIPSVAPRATVHALP